MKRQFLLLLLISVFAGSARAQVPVTARWSSDASSVLVGEPAHLVLVVEAPVDANVAFPEFPTDWPPFVVQSVSAISRTVSGDTATYRQTLTVIAWRPGDHPTPETFVQYQLSSGEPVQSILAEPTVITVPSVLENGDTELRPLKPPVSLPYLPPWLLLVVAVMVVLLTRGAMWWRSRRVTLPDGSLHDGAGNPDYSPKQRALAELRSIRGGTLSPGVVYSTVADCLRTYVQGQFNVSALDMTTVELMDTLRSQAVMPKPQQRDLARMLEYADLVKFADAQPGERAVKQLLVTAEKWIERVEPTANGDNAEA